MVKNIIINISGVNSKEDINKLEHCLESIDAIVKFRFEEKVNTLSLSYDSRALSHANYIYNQLAEYGFEVK